MNDHATRVLDAYLDAKELTVPHAVLIEGRWGSGKTYFLKDVYEPDRSRRMYDRREPHVPFLFVSLFGATSAKDVEMRIYKTACPGEAVAGGIAGTIALGIGEFFRVKEATKATLEKVGEAAIKRLNEFVFVFDDLERIEPKAFGEVMGLVNSLVAEHGRRVLLVTDEDKLIELVDGKAWTDQNEKVVGRRARIEPDLASVIDVSIRKLHGTAKKFVSDRKGDLFEIAKLSGVENLRNVSWAMHNASAFAEFLVADGEIPQEHVARTMGVVFATTLWMRAGLVDADTLKRLPGLSMALAVRSINNKESKPLDAELQKAKEFSDAFAVLSVDTPPVDYGFITAFEKSGVLDAVGMINWIKSQFGFGKEHAEPSWRRLWHSGDRRIGETKQAISDLHDDLAQRAFTEYGPILHAAGLAIRQSRVDDKRLTDGEDIVGFFKRYIDDVAQRKLLKPLQDEALPSVYDSFGGLGFSSVETDEFREIAAYLRSRSLEAAVEKRLSRAEQIFSEAEAGDLDALFQFVRPDDRELAHTPVLMDIPVDRVASFMLRDVPELSAGAKLLAYRYHRAVSGDPLLQEISWAREVYAAVLKGLEKWEKPYDQMGLNTLNGMIRYYEKDKQADDRIIPGDAPKNPEQ